MSEFKSGDRVRYKPCNKESGDWQNVTLIEWSMEYSVWKGSDPRQGMGYFAEKDIELLDTKNSALDVQIGGDHYKAMPIQPMEYSMKNGLDACQHTIIKYVTRFREKGGIEDLEKAKHCIDLLIGFEKEKE